MDNSFFKIAIANILACDSYPLRNKIKFAGLCPRPAPSFLCASKETKQRKTPDLIALRVPENGAWLMRIGKNSANASNICRSDRNAILHFRLRYTGLEGQNTGVLF